MNGTHRVDYWRWCVNGLKGVTSMVVELGRSDMRPSTECLEMLEQQVEQLKAVVQAEHDR